jgi:intraflagellar transport protein 80
MDLN